MRGAAAAVATWVGPVQHGVRVVSQDWLAADRVAVELMGIDFANVGSWSGRQKPGRHSPDVLAGS